jgi:hypothetical protein
MSNYDAGPGQPHGLSGGAAKGREDTEFVGCERDEKGNPKGITSFAGNDHEADEA